MAQQLSKPATTLQEHGQVPRLIRRDKYSYLIRELCEERMELSVPSISGKDPGDDTLWEYLKYYWGMSSKDLLDNSPILDAQATSKDYQAWREYRFTLLALIYVSEGGSFHLVTGDFLRLRIDYEDYIL